jgi:RNA 2',3'-cyclic 3'-phosphodiesterase
MIQQLLPFDGRRAGVQRHSIFFAILPDRVAAASIAQLQRDLRDTFALTSPAIPRERLHVSVFGFGAFLARPDVLIERAACAAASVRLAPFDIVFDQVCSFGRASNAPLVLCGEGAAGVVALAQEIAAAVTQERRATPAVFVPHLTLLYDARRAPKTPISPIRWTVNDLVLIDSLHGRGRHELLGRWRLCGDHVKPKATGRAFLRIGPAT